MSTSIDFKILELLSSKICHDLISPIGAVNNGLEIMEELGPDAGEEVTSLISYSAQQASAKLKAYRIAYGAGGSDVQIKLEDVHKTMEEYLGLDNKTSQDWDPHGDYGQDDFPDALPKLLIICLLIGLESLPKGGVVKVQKGSIPGSLDVICEGPNAHPKDGTEAILKGQAQTDSLEPKNVHAYLAYLIAGEYGYSIGIEKPGDDAPVIITLQKAASS